MAHNLATDNKGEAAFFTVKEKAWHGLGKVLDACPTSEEAIKLAGLDYDVALAPLYAGVDKFDKDTIPGSDNLPQVVGRFATYRKDTGDVFGVVGSRYEPVQNSQAFEFFDSIVGKGEAIYETAGALGKGQIIFVTAKLPDYIKVKDDAIEKFLLFTMAHDGSSAIQAMFTPVRVVCNNTLTAALRDNTNKITIRHTRSVHDKLKEAEKLMGITNMLTNELSDVFNQMSKVRIDEKKLLPPFIGDLYMTKEEYKAWEVNPQTEDVSVRKKNIMNDVWNYYFKGPGQDTETCKGTVFGLYNMITGYYQNSKELKNDDDRLSNNLLGSNARTVQRAFDKCLQLI